MHEQKSDEQLKTHRVLTIGSITKIAAAMNVELTRETILVYAEHLIKLTAKQLIRTTNRTIEEWREPGKMPPIPYIIERSYLPREPHEVVNDAPRILNRPALTGEVETQESRREFSARLIAEMREKLAAGSNSMPAAQMPDDPDKRKTWATATAKKQGWL